MSRVLETLPPPDLSYPPEENDLDRPTSTTETGYLATRLSGNAAKPDGFSDKLTWFFGVVNRLIPENDGVHTCSMCGYVESVDFFLSTLIFRVLSGIVDVGEQGNVWEELLKHLMDAHPRCWDKRSAGCN
jgi:hypothetical protein